MACFTLSAKLATALVDEKNRPPETLALLAKMAVWRPSDTLKAIGSEKEIETAQFNPNSIKSGWNGISA
jgi:hypothetical protein